MLACRCIFAFFAVLFFTCQPLWAEDTVLPVTNCTPEDIASAARGATLEHLPGGYLAVLYPESASPRTIFEARHGGSYDQFTALYAVQPRNHRLLSRVVLLHYRNGDTALAHRLTRLIGRLLRLHRENFGRETVFPRVALTAEVWLNAPARRSRGMGGETWTNHVYLFAVEQERSPLEWVRTLVHEWGHLTLVGARGYTEPETDAAGFLGERLFFKWLYEDPENDGDDLTTRADLALYYRRQVAPLIEQYQDGGPASPLLRQTDTAGMDFYIGGVLAADDALGSSLVGRALTAIESERALDFNRTLREAVQNTASFTVTLPAWVPLEVGSYRVSASEADSLLIADRPPFALLRGTQTLLVQLSGWKWLRSASEKGGRLTFRLIRSGRAR